MSEYGNCEKCLKPLRFMTRNKPWGVLTLFGCPWGCWDEIVDRLDTHPAMIAFNQRVAYQTAHADHPTGAKIETGNPTPLGRVYEENK